MLKRRKLPETVKRIEEAELNKVLMHTFAFSSALDAYITREHKGQCRFVGERVMEGRCLVSLGRLGLFLVGILGCTDEMIELRMHSTEQILFLEIHGVAGIQIPASFRSEAVMSGFWLKETDYGLLLSMPIRVDYRANLFANDSYNFLNVLIACRDIYDKM